jgi:hypothetical protein
MPLELKVIKEAVMGALGPVSDLVDNLHTSREEKDQMKLQLAVAQGNLEANFHKAQSAVIMAEATGASWIQRNWRPITMLSFVFIIVWNYVIGPIGTWLAVLLGSPAVFPVLELPTGLWTTLNVGIGGYMTLRTYEKVQFGKEGKMPKKKMIKAIAEAVREELKFNNAA